MDTPLPSNQKLMDFAAALPWPVIEQQKRDFNRALKELAARSADETLPLETLSDAVGVPVTTYFDPNDTDRANVMVAQVNAHQHVLGSVVSTRYRSGKTLAQSITPYNFNPSVNHTNISETDDPTIQLRALGSEIELGLVHPDGASPSEQEMQAYIRAYYSHALKRGIYPKLDREACQYQVETHIAPGVGYNNTRKALDGILATLASASEDTGLRTAILSAYPTESDFKLTEDPKVQTAVDLMLEVNEYFPMYRQRLAEAQARYHINPANCNYVQMFRLQGCHIHIDIAGRSEALGLLTFYTMLRSATAIANAAMLKGGPFVNGACDAELLCTREYMRRTTVTGRYLELPTSPHLTENGMERYAALLRSERVNAPARAMLYDDTLGDMVSAMHNPVGRVRPDLGTSKRICTLESTGMPANISASRMAAVLTDFELSAVLIEHYFRRYGCDLEPMYNDQTLWAVLGPLDQETFMHLQDASDRNCTDIVLTTAAGSQMSLADFYEMKRLYLHRALVDIVDVTPRAIDDVYTSFTRMLTPPSGQQAETIEQYVNSPKLRSTGNWGRILRNAFIAAGGVPGEHNPDAVLKVVNQLHDAMRVRYLEV